MVIDIDKSQIDLIKLLTGERLIRLTEPRTGLSLEKKLNPSEALVPQKARLLQVFQAALAQAELIGA